MGSFGRLAGGFNREGSFYVSYVGINIHKSERRFSAPFEVASEDAILHLQNVDSVDELTYGANLPLL